MKDSLIVLKLGGSMLTYKNKTHLYLRRKNISQIAKILKQTLLRNPKSKIILIHGAGAEGHFLAHKYKLLQGTKNNTQKQLGSLKTRLANQTLNTKILEIFLTFSIPITTIHTNSLLFSKQKNPHFLSYTPLEQVLKQNLIPLLYGEMIFDEELGMSVCSGDLIAFILAKKYKAFRVLFASDVNGIYTEDPYKNTSATIIQRANLSQLMKTNAILKGSHNIDVTGGLSNKIQTFHSSLYPELEDVCIFNGLIPENFSYIFDRQPRGTQILCT